LSPKLTAPSHCSFGGAPAAILSRSSTPKSGKFAFTMPSRVRRSSSDGTAPRSLMLEPMRVADQT